MKLQLNTGNILNFFYVPFTENYATGLTQTGTVSFGPFMIERNSPQSLINIGAHFSLNGNSTSGLNNTFILRLIRNNDTSSPLFQENYSGSPDIPDFQFYLQYVDTSFPPGTSITGPTEYTIELEYTLVAGSTTSININTIYFSEESSATRILPNIITI